MRSRARADRARIIIIPDAAIRRVSASQAQQPRERLLRILPPRAKPPATAMAPPASAAALTIA
jgi:hypothetical protein